MTGFVYVHSLPAPLARHAGATFRTDAAYQFENRFVARMLNDFSLRTTRFENARLFYVPTWSIGGVGGGANAYEKNLRHLHTLVTQLLQNNSLFQQSWAANTSAHGVPLLSTILCVLHVVNNLSARVICPRRARPLLVPSHSSGLPETHCLMSEVVDP